MLKIENLNKFYGKKQVLFNINLNLEEGDICAFIGANGAGKTTTIKSIIGLIPYDSGQIYINGKNLEDHEETIKSYIAYVPDNPELYSFMRGIDYLNFISDIFGLSLENRRERIERHSRAFGIREALADKIDSYSHGMQQKLALIAALIHTPKLIILDEPFVGLDPLATRYIREEFKRLAKEEGVTILFSTHVLEVAEKLCNKIAIVKDGQMLVFGETQEILSNSTLEDIFVERMSHNA